MSELSATTQVDKNAFDLSAIDNLASTLSTAQLDEQVLMVDPVKTRDNPYQPRKERNKAADNELIESTRTHGIQQPIIVLPADDEGIRTVVFGHRRRDAALAAGKQCPAIERSYDDEHLRVVALIENLQREDMAAKDEVAAVAGLATHVGNARASELLSRKSQYVSKIVKISKSPEPIRELLATGYSTDIAAFYELSLLHNKDEYAAQKIIDRWNADPEQRVSLRKQVAEAKAKVDDKDTGRESKRSSPRSQPNPTEERPTFSSMGFEPKGFKIEKLEGGETTLILDVDEGITVEATFTKTKWSEFLNEVNS